MAETICVSSPTLTSAQVATSHSLRTTTRTSVTTLPASVLTSLYTSCAVSPNTTTCLTSTSLTTQRAVTSTQIVTETNNVDVLVTALTTLYGSSCRTVSSTIPDTPYTPSTDSTPTETPTTTSTITTTSYSTFTSTSLVTSDGTTFTSTYTSVSFTIPVSPSSDGRLDSTASTSTTSTLPGLTSDPLQTNQANTPTGNNTGAIVGGTLGGIIALGLLALLTWHMIKKSNRFDNLFKDEDTNYYGPPVKNFPVNPYQYGLVGQQETQPVGFSPPGSPGFQHANLVNEMGTFNNPAANDAGALHANSSGPHGIGGNEMGTYGGSTGNEVGYNAPNQAPAHHVRNPSAVPLLVGIAGAVSGHTRPNTSSSRASVASSDPLGPLVTHAAPPQNTGYPPQQFNSYPPALAVYAQQQAQIQPQQNIGHNLSIGSSAVLLSSAAGSSSSNPANLIAVGTGSVLRRPTNTSQQQQQRRHSQYEDPFTRTGSPVAHQQQQVLRVRNAEPSNMPSEGSSSTTFGTPGLSISGPPATEDGKGRPFNVGGEKAPLVHLDGGAYEDRPRTPAPPAYME